MILVGAHELTKAPELRRDYKILRVRDQNLDEARPGMQLKNKQTSPPPQFIRDSKDDISGDWSRGSSAVGRTLELKYIKSRNFQYDR